MSLGFSALTVLLLYGSHLLTFKETIVPASIVFIVAFIVLGFKTAKKLEKIFLEVGKLLQNQKFDLAIQTLKSAYPLTRYQFGVKSQLDSQIGMILYLRKEFNQSIPYLEQSKRLGHWMGVAMLAVAYFKKKDYAHMQTSFEYLASKAKKQGLVWNLYAYCLLALNKKEEAQQVLARGVNAAKEDGRVKDNLLDLQNGKKTIKMKTYAEWYQFHLEAPPVQTADRRSLFSAKRRYDWN